VAKRFSATQVESAKKQLQGLEASGSPKNLTLERTIRSLRTDIKEALNRGSSIEDILRALNGSSIDVGITTLKNYLRRRTRRAKITRPRPIPEKRIAIPSSEQRLTRDDTR
jgi:hypothetical protein